MGKPSVQPYLFFNGRCEEAIEFYRTALGAEVLMSMRFKESPDPPQPGTVPEDWGDKIMHVTFRIGESTINASDGCDPNSGFQGFSLSLRVATEAEADKTFAALGEGGNVTMLLSRTFWSPRFGMLTDKFGIGWMINLVKPEAAS